jgi:hypothetical protein
MRRSPSIFESSTRKGVAFEPQPAVLRELIPELAEIIHQHVAISPPALGIASVLISRTARSSTPSSREWRLRRRSLRIGERLRDTDQLDPDLVEYA